ncbi:MAG TPA: GAF domain-containing protein [Chloroflexota bacterium]|nr:GAF domain-containing protein [Chloroflexota bacterium]
MTSASPPPASEPRPPDDGLAADAAFARELRAALVRRSADGAPLALGAHTELIEQILRTAAHALGAEAGVLFLIDHEAEELVCMAALVDSAEARGFRVPLGAGIVGWVAATGQPLAISDASQDPRFAGSVSRGAGYVPKSVLCLPLRSDELVIGVLQLCDKNGGEPFTANDMALLGQFASLAAVAIEQSRVVRDLAQLFCVILQALLPGVSEVEALRQAMETQSLALADRTAQSAQYQEALELTHLISAISQQDPAARRLCQQLLTHVATYIRGQSSLNAAGGWLR